VKRGRLIRSRPTLYVASSRLDLALELMFPASDPISVYIPELDGVGNRTADVTTARVVATGDNE
jgi:hypothetical protein